MKAIVVWLDSQKQLRWMFVDKSIVSSIKLELRKCGTPVLAVIRVKRSKQVTI